MTCLLKDNWKNHLFDFPRGTKINTNLKNFLKISIIYKN